MTTAEAAGNELIKKKRKSTESGMENKSEKKKKRKSSLLLRKTTDGDESTEDNDKSGDVGKSLTVATSDTVATPEKSVAASETAASGKPAIHKTVLKEGEVSPRGMHWLAVEKFCLKMHKVSNIYQDDHQEFKKFKVFAGRTARKVNYCNNWCPGPLSKTDNFETEWGTSDKNRWFVFEFLRKVQKLEKEFTKKCLKDTDKEEWDTIKRAKRKLAKALKGDPVLEYVDHKKKLERSECNTTEWTKSEKHRIMWIYRIKRYYQPNITWDKLRTYFNSRSMMALKMKYRAMIMEAKAKPLLRNQPKKKVEVPEKGSEKPKNSDEAKEQPTVK